MRVHGRGDFVLKEKLRLLKDKLKVWNREIFGKFDLEVEEGVRDFNMANRRLEVDSKKILLENLHKRREVSSRIWRNLKIK